jgi:predicted RecA/RadA family phage recombinase
MAQADFYHGDPVMVDYTPGSAVSAGDVVVVAGAPMVAHSDIPANTLGAVAAGGGVYTVTGNGAIAAGTRVYWIDADNKITATPGGNRFFGFTVSACSGDGSTCNVLHVPDARQATTAIASLTDNSGGTADDTIAAIGGTYSQTEVRNAVADLAAKVNAILAALRAQGIIAS